ncbi:PREDICTED: afamin [Elephantulus edwardii]|uniref:afamin n=1 Tax=Elephantulus edwardii TaxID=28737 RepID=UPI0003F0D80A|nr:PREDICTED: afamin [Elephantulus edwardii]
MKQLKCTDFVIFLFFLSEFLTPPSKAQDVDISQVTQKFILDNAEYLTIIASAQYIQEATFEEVEMLTKEMLELKDKCFANATLPECTTSAGNILQDSICAKEDLSQKYNLSHCCKEIDLKRRLCFLYNKKAAIGFIPPLPTMDVEAKCQAYQQNRDIFINKYIYDFSRRDPFVFPLTLLATTAHFEEVAKACCAEEDKASCFQTRVEPVTQNLRVKSSYQKNICGALMRFGPKVLNAIYTAVISQKFPQIEFKEVASLLEDFSSKHVACCEGDLILCITGMNTIMSHICTKQSSTSSTIRECCKMTIPDREECIIYMYKDEPPKNLSGIDAKFMDNKDVCEHRDADRKSFMTEFLYEYSRRHQDLSIPELLRIAEEYEKLWGDCCGKENPSDCYSHVEEKFNETTEKSLQMVNQECARFQNLGKDDLKYHYLVKLTKMAPQLSTEELTMLSEDVASVLDMCCAQSEKFACVDNLMNSVLGELCGVNKNQTINAAINQCCTSSFAFRRHCFEELEGDKTYVPPSTSQGLFTFHADLCQAQNGVLQEKKNRFLVDLVKLNPQHTDQELRLLLTHFTNVVETCCKAEEPEACFNEEGPKLEAKSQATSET